MNDDAELTKTERLDLLKIIRAREKLAKTIAKERSAELKAKVEVQLSAIYRFDQDKVWENAKEIAENVVDEARRTVAERCKELGIPARFAPDLHLQWYGRGENAFRERRAELRKTADARIDELEMQARVKIERMSLVAQTEVVTNGLSDSARLFLEKLPSIEVLMPELEVGKFDLLTD
jgi:hypothetical protein